MSQIHGRRVRRALPAVVVAGVLAIGMGAGPSGAQTPADPATIDMSLKGRNGLQFKGADEVVAGEELRIRNTTSARRIGPHTFTLVTARLLPKTRRAIQRCFTPRRICMRAANAHRFNPRTEKVNRPLFETGKEGWDKSFSRNRRSRGDSWYTEKKGETFSQVVSAKAGTTLRFLCVVHPEMQGKIDVVQGAPPPTP